MVRVNDPFVGCLVPTKYYHYHHHHQAKKDVRVQSIMIELRRDLYMSETTGQKCDKSFRRLQHILMELRQVLLETFSEPLHVVDHSYRL